MPVTLVGREGHFHGKSLYYIVRNLRNLGVGRIVYRNNFKKKYDEPCFYILNNVKPELNAKGYFRGTAVGTKVWRGQLCGEHKIDSGHKQDWRLVPKENESQYMEYFEQAKSRSTEKRPKLVVSKYSPLPPLMELILRDELLSENLPDTEEALSYVKKIKKSNRHKVIFEEES